ncbi:MAG: zf-HC2 domain-containing protein [Armatimonadota bacterium]
MMNCKNIQKRLSAYVVGDLDTQTREEIETHLRSCPDCRHELQVLRRTEELLQPIQMTDPPAGMWEQIEGRLTPRPVRVRPTVPTWRRMLKPALAGVAIAAILLAVIVGMPLIMQPTGTPAGVTEAPVYASADSGIYTEPMLAAAWDQPLNDEVSLALAMVMSDPQATEGAVQ